MQELQGTPGERLAVLEKDMRDLLGNGQPGRISKLEDAQSDMKATVVNLKWWIILAAVVVVLSGTGPVSLKELLAFLPK